MTPDDARFLAPHPPSEPPGEPPANGPRYLVLPEVVVPLDQPRVFRYALSSWLLPSSRLKATRNAALSALVDRGRFPPGGERVRGWPGRPFLVAAAEATGAGYADGWLFTPGASDALSRNVFHLFEPDAPKPHAVVKFARTPGYTDPFDRDERALALVARAGGSVAAHAPRLLGRGVADGLAMSVETAAPGPRLLSYLTSMAPGAERRAALLRVARWTIEVGRETRHGRVRVDDPAYADAVRDAPAVFAHNDLGTWNVLVDGTHHVAVDWESADPDSLPLADLTYLLFYGLANVTGVPPTEGYFRDLFGGALAESRLVFQLVAECATACGVPDEAVGPIVTLSWLRHGRSHLARGAALATHAPGAAAAETVLARCAEAWLNDPRLGRDWPARTGGRT